MLKTAADLMRKKVISIRPQATLEELAVLLEEENVHGVAVVDRAGLPIGVVSRTDLLETVTGGSHPNQPTSHYYAIDESEFDWDEDGLGPYPDDDTTVGDIMSPRVVRAAATATAAQLARLMNREKVHRVLITEGKQLVGIVSVTDLVKSIPAMERTIKQHMQHTQHT